MRIDYEGTLGIFHDLNCKLPANRWKILEKDFQGVTGFEMLEQNTYRHPCSDENWCTT